MRSFFRCRGFCAARIFNFRFPISNVSGFWRGCAERPSILTGDVPSLGAQKRRLRVCASGKPMAGWEKKFWIFRGDFARRRDTPRAQNGLFVGWVEAEGRNPPSFRRKKWVSAPKNFIPAYRLTMMGGTLFEEALQLFAVDRIFIIKKCHVGLSWTIGRRRIDQPMCRNMNDSTSLSKETFPPPQISEQEWIAQAKADPESFSVLYERYYSQILNYTFRSAFSVHMAEELTSRTFFKALTQLEKYRARGSFRAWLYRIATNEIRMYWRTQKKHHTIDSLWREQLRRIHFTSSDTNTPERIYEDMSRFVQLRHTLGRLPKKYQTVLFLRYFEDLPIGEIADVLGKKTGTIKSLIHRGLKRLRALFKEQDATFS